MIINKFLKIGFISFLLASQNLKAEENYDTFKTNAASVFSENEIKYLKKNFKIDSTFSDYYYLKLNKSITEKQQTLLKSKELILKTLLAKTRIFNNIDINYGFGFPNEMISGEETSVANFSLDINKKCNVDIKFLIDNNNRLVESSELSWKSTVELSSQSDEAINSTIEETLFHESSHCLLNEKMKNQNFSLLFGNKYDDYPHIKNALNDIINYAKNNIKNKTQTDKDFFSYVIYVNFHENFADILSAYNTLGDNPDSQSIEKSKNQILNVINLRKTSGLKHKTIPALQYALLNLPAASKLSPEERVNYAIQLASESLLSNMNLIINEIFKESKKNLSITDIEFLSFYLANSISVTDNGIIIYLPKEQNQNHNKIIAELEFMVKIYDNPGTVTQLIHNDDYFKTNKKSKPF